MNDPTRPTVTPEDAARADGVLRAWTVTPALTSTGELRGLLMAAFADCRADAYADARADLKAARSDA